MDTHGLAHVKLVIAQPGERLLKDGSKHRFRRCRAEAEMRTRSPAKMAHARPANVESIRVGKRPFVTIGGAVEKNYSGLSGNRYARDRNFGGQVPRETLSRGVPAHAFLDRGIDQSPVIAQRLALLRRRSRASGRGLRTREAAPDRRPGRRPHDCGVPRSPSSHAHGDWVALPRFEEA